MAVEARHQSHPFPPQILSNRETMKAFEGNASVFGCGMGYGGTQAEMETLLPSVVYGSLINDVVPAKTAMKADGGLTNALPVVVSRKRSRDAFNNPLISFSNAQQNQNIFNQSRCDSFTFLGHHDISPQIQQQRLEVDRFIAQHTEKVRFEMEQRRKSNSERIIAAVEVGILKKLRAKEEEIDKIGKLNWALEERVKSLCIENQIWRELAHSNEATANALRTNLEQALAQVQDLDDQRQQRSDEPTVVTVAAAAAAAAAAALMDDAESCYGSNYGVGGGDGTEEEEWRTLEQDAEERKLAKDDANNAIGTSGGGGGWKNSKSSGGSRCMLLCRSCGKEESCVLLLPCRHLCLCSVCGSSLHTCPICLSTKNATLHVNMSC